MVAVSSLRLAKCAVSPSIHRRIYHVSNFINKKFNDSNYVLCVYWISVKFHRPQYCNSKRGRNCSYWLNILLFLTSVNPESMELDEVV